MMSIKNKTKTIKGGKCMLKRVIALLLTLVMLIGVTAGCNTSKKKSDGGTGGDEIAVCLGSQPKTIDPTLNNAVDGATMIIHAFEGLTKLDKDGNVVPGMAKDWEMSEDGTVFKFYLRDAKWSDGKPVTAHDFVYSWRRALDPEVGAEYSYQLWYIKNGEAYNLGQNKDLTPEDLGVKALDDKTLEVTLEAPCSYFLELTSFPTLFPLREDVVEANPDTWATKPETYICNGPFKLAKWEQDAEIVFEKNENYYDADTILPKAIKFVLIADANAELAAFRNEEILFTDNVPSAEIPALKAEGTLKIAPYLGTYFYVFNVTKKPFDDPRVRKALSLAIDREYIVEKITQSGEMPAGAFVPPGVPDEHADPDFRTVGKSYIDVSSDAYEKNCEEARRLLKEAGYENGKGFPQVELLYNVESNHKPIAEAVQNMWKEQLGITVKLSGQEWSVFQQTRTDGNFQIARHGWLGDYNDPMTFLDMWTSTSGQNDADWKNEEFDNYIRIAKTSGDRKERMEAMHKAEDILMEEMPIAPVYFYTDPYLINSKLKGFYSSALGFKYFMYCYIED